MKTWFLIPLLFTIHIPISLFGQGGLAPPAGTPAPTMKSLDQIRSTGIAINNANTPGDANYHFIISAPGSYFLAANLSVIKTNGINVTAADVTIDLNGFELARISGSGGDGITISVAANRCTVKNGSVTGFFNGVNGVASGGCLTNVIAASCQQLGLNTANGWQLDRCQAHDNNTVFAIRAGEGSTLTGCVASNNQGFGGIGASAGSSLINCVASGNNLSAAGSAIAANFGCTLTNCSAYNNQATYGIAVGQGSTLTNCGASQNSNSASESYGIYAGNECNVTACTASNNLTSNGTVTATTGCGMRVGIDSNVTDCTASANAGNGIIATTGCKVSGCAAGDNHVTGIAVDIGSAVRGCTARANSANGITVTNNCLLVSNTCDNNNTAAVAANAGIFTSGNGNTIDSNSCTSNHNGIGIATTGTHNIMLRNSCTGNGAGNYQVGSGNAYGPIIDMTAGGAISNTNPWTNWIH